MNKFFILLFFLSSSFLSAEEIALIRENLPVLVKVQSPAKIFKCKIMVPGKGYGTIQEADVTYQLDREGVFSAILRLDEENIDVSSCVLKKDKDLFYKNLLIKAEIEKKKGKSELNNFLKLAIDDTTRFFLAD
jgi:hypothetical protein